MWIYGDRTRAASLGEAAAAVAAALERAAAASGLDRHAGLVAALVAASELLQGVADADFEAHGVDRRSPATDAATTLLSTVADAVAASWRTGFAAPPPGPGTVARALAGIDDPGPLALKAAEGFSLYAVYPEAYAEAARAARLAPATTVIGLRSIGAGLAAAVASAIGAAPPLTLRPAGNPFRRDVRVDPGLEARLAARAGGDFAVVDEGPGLSASSFASVLAFLDRLGADPDRVHLLPSHDGAPGPAASPAIRERYAAAPRHPAPMDLALLSGPDPARRLDGWVADLVGPLSGPLRDVSAGAWRALRPGLGETPVHPWLERRKFLAATGEGRFLVKFAGLGPEGEAKLAVARRLAEAGFAPGPVGLAHGFLVERWVDGRPPGDRDRAGLIERIGAYLAHRARAMPAPAGGADLASLALMARTNAAEALGPLAGAALLSLDAAAARLEGRVRRIWTDGRLHRFEWLVADDGRILKTDAVDHALGHDLVGCQDLAWDVAGAIAEFDLDGTETGRLLAAIGRAGVTVDAGLLAFCRPAYAAFQAGLWTLADRTAGGDGLARREADRHAAALERLIATQAIPV